MTRGFNLQSLVDELEPVKPLDWRRGLLLPMLLTLTGILVIGWLIGMRADLIAGNPHPMFLLRSGLLLLLGSVCGATLLAMASPGVGKAGNGWKIAVAASLLLPFAALIVMITGEPVDMARTVGSGMQCLRMSLMTGLAVATPMVLWLRRGAPVSPERAGWLTGLSAGGFGAFAYGFHCPFNSVVYIGLWYGLAVVIGAIAGRLIVPRLIRW